MTRIERTEPGSRKRQLLRLRIAMPRLAPLRVAKRFKTADDGSVAVEFALIAVPFFALIFAIVETALIMWSSQVLETAVANASRQILTGQVQQATRTGAAEEQSKLQLEKFRELLCADIKGLLSCADVKLDVRVFKSFSDAAASTFPPLSKDDKINDSEFKFEPSNRGEIVVVRAAASRRVYAALLNNGLPNLNGSRDRLIVAVAAFRNEPF